MYRPCRGQAATDASPTKGDDADAGTPASLRFSGTRTADHFYVGH
jgi:hypothetical protein